VSFNLVNIIVFSDEADEYERSVSVLRRSRQSCFDFAEYVKRVMLSARRWHENNICHHHERANWGWDVRRSLLGLHCTISFHWKRMRKELTDSRNTNHCHTV